MSAKHRDLAEILSSLPGTNTLMLYFGLLPPTVMVGQVWNWFLPKKRIKDFEQSVTDLSNPVLENFLAISGQKNLIILTATLAQLFCSLNFTRQKHCFKDVCPTLKACVVTSEMLLKTTKNFSRTTGNSIINEARQN
jgi:hypothetical protein